jgi:hypothetical protein
MCQREEYTFGFGASKFSGVGNSPKAATIDKDTMAGLARWAMAAPLPPFSGAVDTTETASRFASSILQLSLYNGRGLPNARNWYF